MGLVITKKRAECFWIGPDICITIIETRTHDVRLEIVAPASVRIGREERPGPEARISHPCLKPGELPARLAAKSHPGE